MVFQQMCCSCRPIGWRGGRLQDDGPDTRTGLPNKRADVLQRGGSHEGLSTQVRSMRCCCGTGTFCQHDTTGSVLLLNMHAGRRTISCARNAYTRKVDMTTTIPHHIVPCYLFELVRPHSRFPAGATAHGRRRIIAFKTLMRMPASENKLSEPSWALVMEFARVSEHCCLRLVPVRHCLFCQSTANCMHLQLSCLTLELCCHCELAVKTGHAETTSLAATGSCMLRQQGVQPSGTACVTCASL
jgi:hypothetical protein